VRVLDHGDPAPEGIADAAGPLLHHVSELMAEKPLAMRLMRRVLARGEIKIRSDREGMGAQRRRFRAHVDPDVREVSSEEAFHLPQHHVRELLSRTASLEAGEMGR